MTADPKSEDQAFAREVLAAADEALARVLAGVADQVETMPPDLEPADALRWAGDRTTELLTAFAELPLDRLLGLGGPTAATSGGSSAGSTPPAGEPVTVRVAAGDTAEVRVWVHVLTGRTGELLFSLGPLTDPAGTGWTAAEVLFTPATCALPVAGPWSTVLRFRAPADAVPGTHHGLVIARGAATAAVPIMVVIT